tara:strand:+ start:546 stop:800 length:255 start_codon:yes stop_codon:yes gene_type:complete
MDNNEKEMIRNYRNNNRLLEDKLEVRKKENKSLKENIKELEEKNKILLEEKHYYKQRSYRSNTLWSKVFGYDENEDSKGISKEV